MLEHAVGQHRAEVPCGKRQGLGTGTDTHGMCAALSGLAQACSIGIDAGLYARDKGHLGKEAVTAAHVEQGRGQRPRLVDEPALDRPDEGAKCGYASQMLLEHAGPGPTARDLDVPGWVRHRQTSTRAGRRAASR